MLSKKELFTENEQYEPSLILLFTIASSLIWIMVPGLGFLYSGLARRKSALSMIWIVLVSSFIGLFQWYFWGYSLAFSPASNNFIGNLHNFGMKSIIGENDPTATYPELSFAIFQMQFSLVTQAILAGALIGERGRLLPACVFLFCWSTIVYCPVVYWIWGGGWASTWRGGALDYAGGGPVEILSGVSAIAYSAVLGRRNQTLMINYRPHNVSTILLGTAMLYVGWLFFNGFSCANASLKVAYSMMNTHLTAAFAAVSWCLVDYRLEKKYTMVGICSGTISGLVAATPASGIIPLWASVILGICAGIICNFATKIKYLIRVDDSLDVLAEHGIAGIVGLIFNALFGSKTVIGYDNAFEHDGGWLDHNYKQLYIQIVYILATGAYSGGVSFVLAFVIDKIPGLRLRVEYNEEEAGIDESQIGEFAYDYVEVRRDFLDWPVATQVVQQKTSTSVNDDIQSPEVNEKSGGKLGEDTPEITPSESYDNGQYQQAPQSLTGIALDSRNSGQSFEKRD